MQTFDITLIDRLAHLKVSVWLGNGKIGGHMTQNSRHGCKNTSFNFPMAFLEAHRAGMHSM